MICRSKIAFASSEAEIKAALDPHIPDQLLYASLGGSKPDDSYDFQRLDALMRSLDKVSPLSERQCLWSYLLQTSRRTHLQSGWHKATTVTALSPLSAWCAPYQVNALAPASVVIVLQKVLQAFRR